MIKLTITEKGGEPRPLSFEKDEILIGRVQGNDIVLPKGNISKRHTRLAMADGRLTVHDLKSTNGTYVNGRKIAEPTAVRGGDKIFVGDFLILVDGQAPATDAAAGGASSGARRMPGPPPPPPPPPRAGSAPGGGGGPPLGRATVMQMPIEDESDFGALDAKPPTTGRGRVAPPAPPPPPPPRHTIMASPLDDDSVDIGHGEAPSQADASADGVADPGADVFGTSPAPEEDESAGGLGFAPADSGRRDSGGNDALTPVPAAASSQLHRFAPPPPPPPSSAFAAAAPGVAAAAAAGPDTSMAEPPLLEKLLAEANVTAIHVATSGAVKVERSGAPGKQEPAGELGEPNAVAEAVWQLATTAQPPPPPDNPVVDVRLVDGTRVTALFPPVVATGACATIRKAALPEVALGDIAGGSDVEQILKAALLAHRNLVLAGDGAALAALAGAIGGAFPADRRVVSIGAGVKDRAGWVELQPTADTVAVARAAVAFRASHLLIAEPVGAELPDLLLAAARGQEGLVMAVAARSAVEALARMRALSIEALGAAAFPGLLASTVDLVVVAAINADGAVRVVELAEPRLDGDTLGVTAVAKRPDPGRGTGTLEVPGVSPRLAGGIAAGGGALSPHLIRN